ncbi:hypothetical protein [Blastococcus xanthinilyticus]|uniref:Uncharacterized protein n=1 Tax=Blastococcus xanthinilyticus TaxID=1564164 RepID=A0A5S5D2A9_9ACTN|nr:hypothetical protein [Blastococcus xanthinilyticus]TYP89885.1 hypothetical protein BD833_102362 [Blastococcus xanthinilyticus]
MTAARVVPGSARVALGRAEVAREVRAADRLAHELRAPVTARAPWLTAVLNQGAAHRFAPRPAAVVVDGEPGGPPLAAAFLSLRRRGPVTEVSLLGQLASPLPPGGPTASLPARDEAAAERLAAGILGLLESRRGPWSLRLTGLPLGDPTVRALAARLPTAVVANARSTRLVDALDGPVERRADARFLERWLPDLLAALPDRRARDFVRGAARLHAAAGRLELAVVADGGRLRAGLLTLVEGADRRPWWGTAPAGGLTGGMGAPVVGLTAPGRRWPR